MDVVNTLDVSAVDVGSAVDVNSEVVVKIDDNVGSIDDDVIEVVGMIEVVVTDVGSIDVTDILVDAVPIELEINADVETNIEEDEVSIEVDGVAVDEIMVEVNTDDDAVSLDVTITVEVVSTELSTNVVKEDPIEVDRTEDVIPIEDEGCVVELIIGVATDDVGTTDVSIELIVDVGAIDVVGGIDVSTDDVSTTDDVVTTGEDERIEVDDTVFSVDVGAKLELDSEEVVIADVVKAEVNVEVGATEVVITGEVSMEEVGSTDDVNVDDDVYKLDEAIDEVENIEVDSTILVGTTELETKLGEEVGSVDVLTIEDDVTVLDINGVVETSDVVDIIVDVTREVVGATDVETIKLVGNRVEVCTEDDGDIEVEVSMVFVGVTAVVVTASEVSTVDVGSVTVVTIDDEVSVGAIDDVSVPEVTSAELVVIKELVVEAEDVNIEEPVSNVDESPVDVLSTDDEIDDVGTMDVSTTSVAEGVVFAEDDITIDDVPKDELDATVVNIEDNDVSTLEDGTTAVLKTDEDCSTIDVETGDVVSTGVEDVDDVVADDTTVVLRITEDVSSTDVVGVTVKVVLTEETDIPVDDVTIEDTRDVVVSVDLTAVDPTDVGVTDGLDTVDDMVSIEDDVTGFQIPEVSCKSEEVEEDSSIDEKDEVYDINDEVKAELEVDGVEVVDTNVLVVVGENVVNNSLLEIDVSMLESTTEGVLVTVIVVYVESLVYELDEVGKMLDVISVEEMTLVISTVDVISVTGKLEVKSVERVAEIDEVTDDDRSVITEDVGVMTVDVGFTTSELIEEDIDVVV
ncbi:hypothetical protein ACF0H5_024357 [Mactra antiquata]